MCGHCTEFNSFERLYEKKYKSLTNSMLLEYPLLSVTGYAQVCPDFDGLMQELTVDMAISLTEVIVVHAIANLILYGFHSDEYRKIAEAPTFQQVMTNFFEFGERGKSGGSVDEQFSWVFSKRVFEEDGYLSARLDAWTITEAESRLKQYINSCLSGAGVAGEDQQEVSECQETRFLGNWLLVHWLAKQGGTNWSVLTEIALSTPAGVPAFNSNALWLQREAALLLYDKCGIKPFADAITKIRTEMIQYIELMRNLTTSEKEDLQHSVKALGPKEFLKENDFNLRQWLETGDLQLDF